MRRGEAQRLPYSAVFVEMRLREQFTHTQASKCWNVDLPIFSVHKLSVQSPQDVTSPHSEHIFACVQVVHYTRKLSCMQ